MSGWSVVNLPDESETSPRLASGWPDPGDAVPSRPHLPPIPSPPSSPADDDSDADRHNNLPPSPSVNPALPAAPPTHARCARRSHAGRTAARRAAESDATGAASRDWATCGAGRCASGLQPRGPGCDIWGPPSGQAPPGGPPGTSRCRGKETRRRHGTRDAGYETRARDATRPRDHATPTRKSGRRS